MLSEIGTGNGVALTYSTIVSLLSIHVLRWTSKYSLHIMILHESCGNPDRDVLLRLGSYFQESNPIDLVEGMARPSPVRAC